MRLRALDVRDEQRARAVLLLDVDGQAEVDVLAVDARRDVPSCTANAEFMRG